MSKDHFRSNNCCFLKVVRIYARLGSWQNQFLPKVQLALYGYTFWYHDKDSRKRNKSECRLDPNDNTKINERENEAENKRPNWLFLPYCFNCNLFINSLNRFTYRRRFSFLRVSMTLDTSSSLQILSRQFWIRLQGWQNWIWSLIARR